MEIKTKSELETVLRHRRVIGSLLEKINEEPTIDLSELFLRISREENVPVEIAGMTYIGICKNELVDYGEYHDVKMLTEKGRKFIGY